MQKCAFHGTNGVACSGDLYHGTKCHRCPSVKEFLEQVITNSPESIEGLLNLINIEWPGALIGYVAELIAGDIDSGAIALPFLLDNHGVLMMVENEINERREKETDAISPFFQIERNTRQATIDEGLTNLDFIKQDIPGKKTPEQTLFDKK